jgi:hypothetical protein
MLQREPSLRVGPSEKLVLAYHNGLERHDLLQPTNLELNWSGKGQHVAFDTSESLPLVVTDQLGASLTSKVEAVLCRRITLARKTMRCTRNWTVADALLEVYHLQNLRHRHIVQLVGTYLRGREFAILMYPVAHCYLGHFL